MSPRVITVILNYKRPDETIRCVASVKGSDYPYQDILVVDNGSRDGSTDLIRQAHPDVELIECTENFGYAGGNNAGIRAAIPRGYDYFFILNNDATVEKPALRFLVEEGEKSERAVILAPKVCSFGAPPLITSAGTSMDWLRLRPHRSWYGMPVDRVTGGAYEAEILPGSALLLKKSFLLDGGLLDEDFFLIHEDADLCYRSRRRGFLNLVVPAAVVYHQESRTLSSYPFLTEYYSTRNFLRLATKFASPFERFLCAVGLLILMFRRLMEWPFIRGIKRDKASGFFAGTLDFFLGRTGRHRLST